MHFTRWCKFRNDFKTINFLCYKIKQLLNQLGWLPVKSRLHMITSNSPILSIVLGKHNQFRDYCMKENLFVFGRCLY